MCSDMIMIFFLEYLLEFEVQEIQGANLTEFRRATAQSGLCLKTVSEETMFATEVLVVFN